MSVSSIQQMSGASAANATQGVGAPPAMKDEFMRLFIAQLQNQDPLQPQDSSAFVAQLAQLSQVEQAAETNTRLQDIADEQAAAARASLSSLVGRPVTASADVIEVGRGAHTGTLKIDLAGPATEARFELVDASGRTTKSIDLGAVPKGGTVEVPPGALAGLPQGSYQVRVVAKNATGMPVAGSAQVSGVIDAMQLDGSGGRFRIGALSVTPASIVSVGAPAPQGVL